jgi:hypothetical protein
LAAHCVTDADVETAWAFLESEPASADGEHESTEFLMRNHINPLPFIATIQIVGKVY